MTGGLNRPAIILACITLIVFSLIALSQWYLLPSLSTAAELSSGSAFSRNRPPPFNPFPKVNTSFSEPALRIAVCVVGSLRTFRLPTVSESLRKQFLSYLAPAPQLDLFWDTSNRSFCSSNHMHSKEDKAACSLLESQMYNDTGFQHLVSTWPFRSHIVHSTLAEHLDCQHSFLREEVCCLKQPQVSDESAGGEWQGYFAYQRKNRCYDYAKNYARENKFEYDLFIVTRPDLYYIEPVVRASNLLMKPNRVYGMSKEHGEPFSDFWYAIPSALAPDFFEHIRTFMDKICVQDGHPYWPPEYRFNHQLELMPRQLWPLMAMIVRESGRADCGRLNTEVLAKTIPYLYKEQLMTAQQYCEELVREGRFGTEKMYV